MSENQVRIMLVDDHMVVREGFRKLLELEPDFKVVGEARNGRTALVMTRKLLPDVVVMDIAMPMLNGFEATRKLRKEFPAMKVLILSAHHDDAYVQTAIELGAVAYLLKQTSAQELSRAIREVMAGKTFFCSSITKRLDRIKMKATGNSVWGGKGSKSTKLTSRETEVLQLIAEGKANKETASELGISIKTVEKHREHLMQKLDIHDTASLTRYAITVGIIENTVQVTII
jgi:DNA-binding NarL/FixJ family response regulator